MKVIYTFALLLVLSVTSTACDEDERGVVCRELCADKAEASTYDAQVHQCSVADDVLSDYVDQCRTDCVDVLNYFVDDRYRPETVDCLHCIHDEVSDAPTEAAIAEAKDGNCYPLCKEIGPGQFFTTFFISPPAWECD